MADRRDFQDRQYAFAAHIRDPEHRPAPEGIEDRRMALYRELFFNNLRNLLATFFPVLRKLHNEKQWAHFIREFMRHHQSTTPYFLELPEEFLSFLQTEYESRDDDYPFLLELAHYEYIELALSVSTEINDLTGIDTNGDLMTGVPVKSPLAWVYAYHYPVHRISPTYLPEKPLESPVFLAVYRSADDKVGFLELNPVTTALLNAIDENKSGQTGRQLLQTIAADINYPDVDGFLLHGAAALSELHKLEILTGIRAPKIAENKK